MLRIQCNTCFIIQPGSSRCKLEMLQARDVVCSSRCKLESLQAWDVACSSRCKLESLQAWDVASSRCCMLESLQARVVASSSRCKLEMLHARDVACSNPFGIMINHKNTYFQHIQLLYHILTHQNLPSTRDNTGKDELSNCTTRQFNMIFVMVVSRSSGRSRLKPGRW